MMADPQDMFRGWGNAPQDKARQSFHSSKGMSYGSRSNLSSPLSSGGSISDNTRGNHG